MTRPTRRPWHQRLAPAVATAVALWLAGARDPSWGSDPPRTGREAWPVGVPLAVPSPAGRTLFHLPTPAPGSRTLLIVSSLARTAGPFPFKLTARTADPSTLRDPRLPMGSGPEPAPTFPPPTLDPVGPEATSRPPALRSFHILARDGDVASASNYDQVSARLSGVGRRVQVYVDQADLASVRPGLVGEIIETFDTRVFPAAAASIGTARDTDQDGRFTVLVSGRLTRLGGGRHAVDGFVRGSDLDPTIPEPFSNHGDMMYLSSALAPGPHLKTVIAHEYTHAVTFSARRPGSEEEGWLDEALAHLVEDLNGFSRTNLDYRVSAFLSCPESYRLVVDNYYNADLFRGHGNRGATYLFLRWCVDRFGPGLIPALVRSDRRGVANLEAATGKPFAELYRAWSVALFLSGLDPARDYQGGFRSMSPRGAFDAWQLAGPRAATLAPGDAPLTWESAGRGSRFVVIGASPSGAAEVEVSAPADSELQVTVVRLPDEVARLELAVTSGTDGGGLPALFAEVRETLGTGVRLTSLSWEPLVPRPNPRDTGFRRDGLSPDRLSLAFGGLVVPGGGELRSAPIPARSALADPSGPLVVKAQGVDVTGRTVTAWAEVSGPLAPEPRARPAVASEAAADAPRRADSN